MAAAITGYKCAECGIEKPKMSTCARCKLIRYCGPECQKLAWKTHKKVCQPPEPISINVQAGREGKSVQTKAWSSNDPSNPGILSKKVLRVVGKEMNQTGSKNLRMNVEQDVVNFSTNYSPDQIKKLQQEGYKGLQGIDLDEELKNQNYVEILKHVWTEENLETAIQWLKPRAEQGHAILMFELSRALTRQVDRPKDFSRQKVEDILRWYTLGGHCTTLDVACNTDLSTEAAPGMLMSIYNLSALPPAVVKRFYQLDFIHKTIASWTPSENHPSPKWVVYHGMGVFQGRIGMKPEAEWLSLRCETQKTFLSKLSEKAKNLNLDSKD